MKNIFKKIIWVALILTFVFPIVPSQTFVPHVNAQINAVTDAAKTTGKNLETALNSATKNADGSYNITVNGKTSTISAAQYNSYKNAASQLQSGNEDSDISCWFGRLTSCLFAHAGNFALKLSAWFLYQAGSLLDWSINYSLNISEIMTNLPFVSVGWKVLLNVTNLAYIFILLFLSINIILGTSTYGNKALIAKVIVTAIVVNFSLFGTKLVIDVANITALQFYNLLKTSDSSKPANISEQFMNALKLGTIYSNGKGSVSTSGDNSASIFANSLGSGVLNTGTTDAKTINWRIATVGILGSIFVLVAAVVFAAGGVMFLGRTLMLLFIMMFSSLAVASKALPKTEPQFDKWWGQLVNNAILAPVFVGLLYIIILAFSNNDYAKNINFANMILRGDNVQGIATFIMILGSLVGVLMISAKLGGMGANFALGLVNKKAMTGYGKWLGGQAWRGTKTVAKGAAVRTLGAGATKFAESGFARQLSRFVPGSSRVLSKVGDMTGYNDLRNRRGATLKAKNEYISGVSPQGRFESNESYKKRQENARVRGLSHMGLDAKGELKKSKLSRAVDYTIKRALGGETYSQYQRSKQKEAQGKAKAMERKKQVKEATWNGIAALTGLDLKKRDASGAFMTDASGNHILDENAVYNLYQSLESKSAMTINRGAAPGTWNVNVAASGSIPALTLKGQGLNDAINAAGASTGTKEFKQEIKEILAKASTLKNIIEKEAEDAGK